MAISTGNNRGKQLLIVALFLFVVPLLGWMTSVYVENEYENQFREWITGSGMSPQEYRDRALSYLAVCGEGGVLKPTNPEVCAFADEIEGSRLASIVTAGVGILLLVLLVLAKVVAGKDRKRLSLLFGPTIRFVMLLLVVSVAGQAGLFIYSFYTIETMTIGRVHAGFLLIVGIGALVGCLYLLKSAFGFFKVNPLALRAKLLDRADSSNLYSLVGELARKLGAQPPDHIVVGLEPTFFVTSADVELIGVGGLKLEGRTLFLSLSLMEVFSKDELCAVIGHELGHFRGQDTEYSLKFAPTYSRLSTAINAMSAHDNSGTSIALLPALAMLSLCLTEFASAERTVGRERELLADQAGAEAASAQALAIALVKVSVFSGCWSLLTERQIDELVKGSFVANLSRAYGDMCQAVQENIDWDDAKAAFFQFVQPHPTDTHPPLVQRLQSLGVNPDSIDSGAVVPAPEPAISLIANYTTHSEELTVLEIRWLEAIGAVVLPAEAKAS
jgi:Zn-dependent protease with chaperone function